MRYLSALITSSFLLVACGDKIENLRTTDKKTDESELSLSNSGGDDVTIVGIDGDKDTDNNYPDHGEVLRGVLTTIGECLRSGRNCNLVLPKVDPYYPKNTFCRTSCRMMYPRNQALQNACVRECNGIDICYYDPNKPGDLMRCKKEQDSDINIDICHNIPDAGGIQNCDNSSGVGEPGTPTRVVCCKPGMIPSDDKFGECTFVNPGDKNLREEDLKGCISDIFR